MKSLPAQSALNALFRYDRKGGRLLWRPKPGHDKWNARYAGKPAGYRRKDGYWVIDIRGKKYLLHRLIWKLETGKDPISLLDHRDTNASNNRFRNLREATVSQNMMNQRSFGKYLKGVYFHRQSKRFAARINKDGKCKSLGYFKTEQEAHAAYVEAARITFGQFARAA